MGEVQDSAKTLSDPSWNTDQKIIHVHTLELTTAHKYVRAKISPACEMADLSLTYFIYLFPMKPWIASMKKKK